MAIFISSGMGGDLIDDDLIILALISIPPMWLGFALPRWIRRPLVLLSLIVLVRSLFGRGIDDPHFIAYISNLIFLIGGLAREAIDALARRRVTRQASGETGSPFGTDIT